MSSTNLSSGHLTSSTALLDRRGILTGVQIIGAANAGSVIVYDNATAASGTILAYIKYPANELHQYVQLPEGGLRCENGLYVDMVGTGVGCVIHYK